MKRDLFLSAAVALLLLTFMAQNYEIVDLKFLMWTASVPRAVLLLGVFFGGALVGWLMRGSSRKSD